MKVAVCAIYEYKASAQGISQIYDLSFMPGDLIAVFDVRADGWWSGMMVEPQKAREQIGRHLFPSNYVQIVDYNSHIVKTKL